MIHSPRRIIDTSSGARPYAAWLSGVAAAMLAVGTYGARQPLLPPLPELFIVTDDSVEAVDFQPPAEAAAAAQVEELQQQPPELELEIPPLPDITPPLTPSEVPELVPVDKPPPPPLPKEKPPERKKDPTPARRKAAENNGDSGSSGTGSNPTLFTGGGGGRFPEPSYPASARSSRVQGTVRLLITVEASGLPSSVDVTSSSGSSVLDGSASDHIRRRWRWPSGPVRRYIVPIRFQLR